MGAPYPAGGPPPAGVDASLWQVLSALGDLREDIRGITVRLDRDFVRRTEHDQFAAGSERDRALLHAEDQRLEGRLEEKAKALADRIDSVEQERKNDRHWALGLLATILIALVGFGVTVIVHYL